MRSFKKKSIARPARNTQDKALLRAGENSPAPVYAESKKLGRRTHEKDASLGLSVARYEETARTLPEAFGLSKSTVSKRFIQAGAKKLRELSSRRLDKEDIVALFIDGKSFAEDGIIIAVGITLDGKKVILGFIQAASENERVILRFFEGLIERGLTSFLKRDLYARRDQATAETQW